MTKVYGCSDDLIEFEGDLSGEISAYSTDDSENGILIIFSDGTMFEVKYGKLGLGIWSLNLLKQGNLFDRIDLWYLEDPAPYSDIAYFKSGKLTAIACRKWENVK